MSGPDRAGQIRVAPLRKMVPGSVQITEGENPLVDFLSKAFAGCDATLPSLETGPPPGDDTERLFHFENRKTGASAIFYLPV